MPRLSKLIENWRTASAGNGGAGTHATRQNCPSTSRWGWAPGISTDVRQLPAAGQAVGVQHHRGGHREHLGVQSFQKSHCALHALRTGRHGGHRAAHLPHHQEGGTPGSPAASSSGTSGASTSCPTAPTAPAALWIKRSGPGFWRPARWANSPAPSWASTKTIRRTTTVRRVCDAEEGQRPDREHTMVYGATGAGKSAGFVKPFILQCAKRAGWACRGAKDSHGQVCQPERA